MPPKLLGYKRTFRWWVRVTNQCALRGQEGLTEIPEKRWEGRCAHPHVHTHHTDVGN